MELKNGLLILYIVVTAGYFEPLFSCDLQRLFTESVLAKHALAFISTFFLVTLVEDTEIQSLGEMFKTTATVYSLYIASVKAKAVFVLSMLTTLFADQILRVQVNIIEKRQADKLARDGDLALKERLIKVRAAMTWIIVALIVTGMLHYYVRARHEFGASFNPVTFIMGTKRCAHGPSRPLVGGPLIARA